MRTRTPRWRVHAWTTYKQLYYKDFWKMITLDRPCVRNGDGARTAIVVLGAAVLPDGSPSAALARRAAHAAALLAEGRGGIVIASGGRGEAAAIRRTLTAAGVPQAVIVEEAAARSTFENAANTIPLMRAREIGRAVVVSDRYHLRRAVLTFRLLGMPATGSAPSGSAGTPMARVREAVALPLYVARAAVRRLAGGRS